MKDYIHFLKTEYKKMEIKIKEFKVNEYITLRLEKDQTIIYVSGKKFQQCKYLAFNIPVDSVQEFDTIQSIDEMEQKDRSSDFNALKISPKQEFWGHCSNIQVWYENNYDTRLLHSNLAFPLLKILTHAGDPIANKIFKEEIAKRIKSNYSPVVEYLLTENYLGYLNEVEKEALFGECEFVEHDGKKTYIINGILNLSFEMLTVFPESIGELKSLQKLELWSNKLKEIPESIGKLESLQALSLENNKLKELPESIGKLKTLQELYLGGNKLKILPESIGELKSLQKLYLSSNKLKILPESIGELKSLQTLFLGSNKLKELPESIGDLKSLKELDSGRNRLKKLPKSIGNLKSLQKLYLWNNKLKELPESIGKSIGKLESLQKLYIENNKLKELPESLRDLKKRGVIIYK